MGSQPIIVGSFPYAPGFNPYQSLFTGALESAGMSVVRISPRKWMPLSHACKQDVDILHLDWHYDWYRGKNALTQLLKSGMYAAGLRACRKLPVVWTAHNLSAHDTEDSKRDHKMTQALLDCCAGVMVMSDESGRLLQNHFRLPDRLRVCKVPLGHFADCYENSCTQTQARSRLGIDPEQFVFLSLGSIRPYKGHLDLVHCFSRIATKEDRLIIAGAPTDREHTEILRKTIRDHENDCEGAIEFHPRTIPETELQFYLNAADVSVLPFAKILNSASLLLAMSFGSPVVVPLIGSIPEIILPESSEAYTPDDSGDALCDAMQRARERFYDRNQCAERISLIREKYDWRENGIKLRAFYSSLLGRAS